MISDIEALWQDCEPLITNYIKQRIQHKETAEDITQTVFLRAWAAEKEGRGYTEHGKGWLFRIAHNLIIDHYRTWQRNPTAISLSLDSYFEQNDEGHSGRGIAEIIATDEPSPHEIVERSIVETKVRKAVGRLVDGQKLVVNMRLDGYSFDEIAQAHNSNVGAVKALQHRGHQTLNLWLKDVA